MCDRNLTLLSDDGRFVRKKALTELTQVLSDPTNSAARECLGSALPNYASAIASALNDPVEVNRESAVKLNHILVANASDCTPILPSLFPVLVKRLGQKEIVEPAEELRLETLKLIEAIMHKDVDLAPYVDDILLIIQHTLSDSFHEVKKLSCSIVQSLATKKFHRFYQSSESIISPLVNNLLHQHSKVRVCTVQAIGTVMIYSQGKLVDQVITPLTQRLFDEASSVRRTVIEVVGSWLLDLPDRYSFHTKLLPLILSGLIDESADIRSLTEEFWHDIGLKYEKENEEQLKDKLDFGKTELVHYPLGCKKPLVGCRELVYRSASRILPALCRDLADWQATTRSKAAALIPVLILHLEDITTQHTQHLITGLSTGLADAVAKVAPSTGSVAVLRLMPHLAFSSQPLPALPLSVNQNGPPSLVPRLPSSRITGSSELTEACNVIHQLLLAAQLVGAFVESKLWWSLLRSCFGRCTESAAPTSLAGHLLLLAGLMHGASLQQLVFTPEPETPSASDTTHPALTNGDSAETRTSPSTILRSIVSHLASDELLSVVSFGAKAAMLECVLVILRRLEESVFLARKLSSQSPRSAVEPSGFHSEQVQTAATILVSDDNMRSLLFQIILALGAVWTDSEASSTDFGTSVVQLTLEATRRLASCERDLKTDSTNMNGEVDQAPIHAYSSDLLKPAKVADVDYLYTRHMLKLFQRLESTQTESGSWHPRSVGLAIFSRCLQTAGPSLLMDKTEDNGEGCLPTVLRLLERGCRLDRVAGSENKEPGGSDPLTMASEAELRLRGLLLLTRLTDNGPIRSVLASPPLLSRCLTHLVLPACVWRAGRTAGAMRKAAVTCLVALLAAATNTYDLDEANVDSRTTDEILLDKRLSQRIGCVQKLLGAQVDVNGKDMKSHTEVPRLSTLPTLPASVLSTLLTRLGGLLEDDLEATRRMACLNVTLLFNGLLLPVSVDGAGSAFLHSPTWLATEASQTTLSSDSCPSPNSFGDQVYRFYPNLVKRLNDAKDPIRLLVTESLNAWIRITKPMLTCSPAGDNASGSLNTVHSAVIEDLINGILPHLDDSADSIRGAVARVLARVAQFAPDLVRRALTSAAEKHRASELCHQLIELIKVRSSPMPRATLEARQDLRRRLQM